MLIQVFLGTTLMKDQFYEIASRISEVQKP